MKKTLTIIGILTCTLCFTVAAKAEMVSDLWNYSVEAKIIDYTLSGSQQTWRSGNTNYNSYVNQSSDQSQLSWGYKKTNSNSIEAESSIKVQGLSGTYKLEAPAQQAATFTHSNKTINGNVPTPTYIDVALKFNISNAGDPSIAGTATIDLLMGFWETPNSGSGSPGFSDDIFYFLNPFDTYDDIQLGESEYYVSLYSSFKKLDQDDKYYKKAAERLAKLEPGFNYGDDIWGWITPENKVSGEDNSFSISFQITEELPPPPSVPEPATMLIFGLAAVGGLPIALRRRMARNDK